MTEKIRLDEWDNINTVRERLEAAEASRVLLVIPARCREMRNLVNLKLLRRYAQDLRIRVRVVAEDMTTRALAKEAGLAMSPIIALGLGERFLKDREQAYKPRATTLRARRSPDRGEGHGFLIGISVVAVILGVILATLVMFLPTAVVTLVPVSEPVSARLEVTAEWGLDEIDYGRARVPARWVEIEIEGEDEIPATGMMDVPEMRAQGEAVFANRSSDRLLVPKGTIVRTGSGVNIRFFTVSEVELPGILWGHARVGIIAMEPGPSGNVKALTVNTVEGPLEFLVDVLNDAPIKGGTIKRVAIVAPQDHNRLRDSLVQRLQQEAYSRLVEQLDEGEFIPAESVTVEIVEDEFAQAVGEQTEMVWGRMLVNVGGLAVDGDGANALLKQLMGRSMPDGYCLQESTLRFRDVGTMQVHSGLVQFTRMGSGVAMSCTDEEELRRELSGKTLNAASKHLDERMDLVEFPSISIVPALFGRMPFLSQRIELRIEAESR
ncbi:MAG: baseplate J/gp47 family protein [Anaerolineae bacterium]|nr:baseplate J/gp47 family protein [Anaerolineae bacterium]